LIPTRVEPELPPADLGPPALLRIVRGGEPHPTAALACAVKDLARWADAATAADLEAVRAARCGGRAVLLGATLPPVPGATRFWGHDVYIPVGFRAEPDLPPAALRAVVGAAPGDVVLLAEDGVDLIPGAAFAPLTRAGVRLALAPDTP
jgi:hypothetical protein